MKKRVLGVVCLLLILGFLFATSRITAGVSIDTTSSNEDTDDETETEETEEEGVLRFGLTGIDEELPYFETMKQAIQIELNRRNCTLSCENLTDKDAEKQLEQVREFIDAKVDAVFFCPVDRESEYTETALKELREANIPVINIETEVKDLGEVEAFVGADNREAGYICGKDLVERKEKGGSAVILESSSVLSVNERITGFEKAITNKGFEIIAREDVGEDSAKAKEAMAEILVANPRIDVVMCGSDEIALAALQAIQEAGRSEIMVYGVEGSPKLKTELAKGDTLVAGTAALSPIGIGKDAVETALKILNDEDYDSTCTESVYLISKENISLYGADGWQ